MFSKACEYGIRASLYVATQSLENRCVGLKDIAAEIDSPVAFTAKILQKLVRHKLLSSVKGPSGGFKIKKENIARITLSEVVDAIDGDAVYRGCGLGLKECNATKPCPLHDQFVKVRGDLRRMLDTSTLQDLVSGLEQGATFLKRPA